MRKGGWFGAVCAVLCVAALTAWTPGASAGPLQKLTAPVGGPLPSLPSVIGQVCPEAGPQPDIGQNKSCSVGTVAECVEEWSLDSTSTGRQGCAVTVGDVVVSCYETAVSSGLSHFWFTRTLGCSAGNVSITCTQSGSGGGGATSQYFDCAAAAVRYSEASASGWGGSTDRTTITVGDVVVVCDRLPDKVSCAPA